MKNLLVLLVAIGLPLAYWYQLPEPPKPVEATPIPAPRAPVAQVRATPFVPAHTALDEPPASASGKHQHGNSLRLGSDASPAPNHP